MKALLGILRLVRHFVVLGLAGLLTLEVGLAQVSAQEQAASATGVVAHFTTLDDAASIREDFQILPNAWLYVPEGQSPTPFLPAGPFEVTLTGNLNSPLRSFYQFALETRGTATLMVNGSEVLQHTSNGEVSDLTKFTRLNKGDNEIQIRFISPESGPASVRFYWAPRKKSMDWAPNDAWSHDTSKDGLAGALSRLKGRELALENRCQNCHTMSLCNEAIPELSMGGPDLSGIGSRRGMDWMARWIEDPRSLRSQANMPKLFHGETAQQTSRAVAAFLASLDQQQTDESPEPTSDVVLDEAQLTQGKELFAALRCVSCHQLPGADRGDETSMKISLNHVNAKFPEGRLAEFLQQPDRHYAWIRMPQFQFSSEEALAVAGYLRASVPSAPEASWESSAELVIAGKKAFQETGCLNCHSLNMPEMENSASFVAWSELKNLDDGCLLPQSESESAPGFSLSEDEISSIQAFAKIGDAAKASLSRSVPLESAQRFARQLNCVECHQPYGDLPQFSVMGGKLKPEWMEQFIGGHIGLDMKPRPWIKARMPGFPQYAGLLSQGLAIEHGLPPATAVEEKPVDPAMVEISQQMVSSEGGFNCISCHTLGQYQANAVFESAGINLAYTYERLQKEYYYRWMRNPLEIDSRTKMPAFFASEKSPLDSVLEGSSQAQMDAIWDYIREGNEMPKPVGYTPPSEESAESEETSFDDIDFDSFDEF